MSDNNFYLDLLNKQVRELKKIIKEKENYYTCAYNCILAGVLIRMNAIVEQCLLDFHSENFEEVSKLIYDSRQLLIHYSDYRTFSNIEEISKKIISEFENVYLDEKEYFQYLLNFDNSFSHNVVINKSKNVIYDEFTNCYVFKNDNVEISVSSDRVIRIQDLKRRRDIAYIIDCDGEMNYFSKGGEYEYVYKELSGYEQLQHFFNKNFDVVENDFNKHKELIKEVLTTFYREENYTAMYIKEKLDADSKKLPIWMEISKLLDNYFNNSIVYKQFLENRVYTNMGIPQNEYYQFKKIGSNCKEDLENNVTKSDFFFIDKCISVFDNLQTELVKNNYLCDEKKDRLKVAMLINWADHTFKNFSDHFIDSNKEFKKLHINLITYRNFFAHNILQMKTTTAKRILEEFCDISRGYVAILRGLNINKVIDIEGEHMVDFVAIERTPRHFFNSKYEQYIKIDPSTYIGNKLFYSTRGSNYNKIIGIVAVDKKFPLRGAYYEKKDGEFVAKTFKDKGGKKHNLLVTKLDYSKGKEVRFDVNLTTLFDIYVNSRLAKSCNKKVVIFNQSSDNNYQAHAAYLDEIIYDYYQQRFLPFELVKKTKAVISNKDNKISIKIVDEKGKVIAVVVDKHELNKEEIILDKKGYFTINETIHDFKGRK